MLPSDTGYQLTKYKAKHKSKYWWRNITNTVMKKEKKDPKSYSSVATSGLRTWLINILILFSIGFTVEWENSYMAAQK